MNKNFSFDIIRSTAIIFVIFIHSMGLVDNCAKEGTAEWVISKMLHGLIHAGVPLFVMLSGALLLGKEESLKVFFRKRMHRLLAPFVTWSVIVSVILYVQNGGRNIADWASAFVHQFVTEGVHGIYWYVYLIVGLYLITPVLRRVFSSCNKTLAVYVSSVLTFIWLLGNILPQCMVVSRFACDNLLYICYFVWGYVLFTYLQTERYFHRTSLVMLGGTYLLSCITTGFADYLTPIVSVSLFALLLTVKIEGRTIFMQKLIEGGEIY